MSEPEHDARYRSLEDEADERAAIVAALDETSGALAKTAVLLGMSRTTLWRKLKQHGLSPARSADESTPPEMSP